ncbi:MAG: hypothetical protein WC913_01215 [Desulfuromonas sp.]
MSTDKEQKPAASSGDGQPDGTVGTDEDAPKKKPAASGCGGSN